MAAVAALDLAFVASAERIDQLPDSDREVAVIGRSNVGKSSLLNALARRKQLARTSKSPGRTRLLNVFTLAEGGTLVDLPGYGYAKASKADRAVWQQRMEDYLRDREPLVMILALIDGAVGPTRLDLATQRWMLHHELPFTVVATKHDKVKSSQRQKQKRMVRDACVDAPGGVRWVSAVTGVGVDDLRVTIREWLAA